MVLIGSKFFLSPSTLNLFQECPRCFWLDKVKNIKRPRGIFPSLPGGMDRVIKAYLDTFRIKNRLPPELSAREFENTHLFTDQAQLEKWRNWRTGLAYEDKTLNASLNGALDDLLVKESRYIPFDYKTKGSPTTEADAVRYYQNQLDCYALLLQENKRPIAGYAFLMYFSPKSVDENGRVQFEVQAIRVAVDPERARETFRRAVFLLNSPPPRSGPACEYCGWLSKFHNGNDLF